MTASLETYLSELCCGDDERAEAAAVAIAALPASQSGEALAALQGLLGDPRPDVRWWAVRALTGIQNEQVLPSILAALADPDTSVRQCAALGLRLRPDAQAVPALVQALADRDPLVVALAADALTEIGEPAVPALLEVVQYGKQAARLEAVRALAEIGDHRSIPALFAALDEGSALMEYWASEGLERMGVGMAFFTPD
jgi:HEAT repeat protein